MAEPETIHELAGWVLSLDSARLPPAVNQQARLLVLDTIGCALAALDEPEANRIIGAVESLGGAAQSTIIGAEGKSSAVNAVLANGALLRFLDLNDFVINAEENDPVMGGHPSDNIAVALSVGEWRNSPGVEIIAAVVLGYEIYNRLGSLMERSGPWDGTSVSGLVAAAMTGRLMNLDAGQLAHALALGASRCVTPAIVRGGRISAAKFLANSMNAQSGAQAAILASQGLTGPLGILDDERGLQRLFGSHLDILTAPFDDGFAIMRAEIKAFPCLATGQTAVAAAIEMHRILNGHTEAIESIEVVMADCPIVRRQQSDQDRRRPDSREAADHSFYFLVAAALTDGELGPRQFDGERWYDPAILSLMERTTMRMDETWTTRAPSSYPCTLRVVTVDGRDHAVEIPYTPGHSEGGLDASVVEAKFDAITESSLADKDRTGIKDSVSRLEEPSMILQLMGFLAGNGRITK